MISLFIAVTETAMVIGATKTTGNVQLSFVVFSMIFATMSFLGFFTVLWKKPWVFYPPESFKDATPSEYIKAFCHVPKTAGEYANELAKLGNASANIVDLIKDGNV